MAKKKIIPCSPSTTWAGVENEIVDSLPTRFMPARTLNGPSHFEVRIVKIIKRSRKGKNGFAYFLLSDKCIDEPGVKPFFYVKRLRVRVSHANWLTDGDNFWAVDAYAGSSLPVVIDKHEIPGLFADEMEEMREAIRRYIEESHG